MFLETNQPFRFEKIFKMEPSAEGSWEEFAELDLEETESPYLIMYNN